MRKLLCEIFKSSLKDEMYLYVARARGLEDVPAPLLERFGKPVSVMIVLLDEDKKLARAEASAVMSAIDDQGFYLQMPPAKEAYLLDAYRAPTQGRY